MLGEKEIQSRFGFHKATIEGVEATVPKHSDIRYQFMAFAKMLDETLPEGRYKALMWTELENASMWAHKSIAETAPLSTD